LTHQAGQLRGSLANNHRHWARHEIDGLTGRVLQIRNQTIPSEPGPAGKLLAATMLTVGMNTAAALALIQEQMGVERATSTVASTSDFGVRVQRVFLSNPPTRPKYGNLYLGDFKYLGKEERLKPRGFKYSIALKNVHAADETAYGLRIGALKEGVGNYTVNPRTSQFEIFNDALAFRLGKMAHQLIEGDLVGEGKFIQGKDLLSEEYSFQDLVLPVVGEGAIYPKNPSATAYRTSIDRLGLKLEDLKKWKGSYRKALITPTDIEWDIVKLSSGDNPLMLDIENMPGGRKVTRGLKETYLRLRFTLTEGDPKVVIQELLQRPFNEWS